MSEAETIYASRTWLNSDESMTAFVSVDGRFTPGLPENMEYLSLELTVGDCAKIVCLDFSAQDKDGIRESMKKLARLQSGLDHVRHALIETEKVMRTTE